MKKFTQLLFLLLTLVGCNQKEYYAEDLDINPTVVLDQSAETIYKNTPVRMKLKINNTNPNIASNLAVSYSVSEGNGYIVVADKDITPNTEFKPTNIEDAEMPFTYIPARSGKQTLVFNVRGSKNEVKSTKLDVLVEELYYKVLIENMPTDPKLGRKESFDIVINYANEEETPIKTCKATATINKGAGKIEYNGAELSTSPVNMTLGRNTISYTSTLRGENIIQLNLQAENGYVQPVYIPIEIGAPDYTLELIQEENPNITAGKDYSFSIKINEEGLDPENVYTMSYRFIKNSGSIKINNTAVEVGASAKCNSGSNVIVYNGTEGGDAEIEFIVKDKNNSERKVTAKFNVAFGKIAIITEKLGDAVELETTPLDIRINQIGYTGKYQVSLMVVKGAAEILWNNAQVATNGSWISEFSSSEVLQIKPTQVGELEIRIKVQDNRNEVSDPSLVVYTVKSQEPIMVTNSHILPTVVGSPAQFTIRINKDGYTGEFQTNFTNAALGELLIDNKIVTSGVSFELSPGEHQVQYIPYSLGNNLIKFTFSDNISTKDYNVNVVSLAKVEVQSNVSDAVLTGNGTYNAGEICVVEAIHSRMVFEGWYMDGRKVATSKRYSFVVTKALHTIEAKFVEPINTIWASVIEGNSNEGYPLMMRFDAIQAFTSAQVILFSLKHTSYYEDGRVKSTARYVNAVRFSPGQKTAQTWCKRVMQDIGIYGAYTSDIIAIPDKNDESYPFVIGFHPGSGGQIPHYKDWKESVEDDVYTYRIQFVE